MSSGKAAFRLASCCLHDSQFVPYVSCYNADSGVSLGTQMIIRVVRVTSKLVRAASYQVAIVRARNASYSVSLNLWVEHVCLQLYRFSIAVDQCHEACCQHNQID